MPLSSRPGFAALPGAQRSDVVLAGMSAVLVEVVTLAPLCLVDVARQAESEQAASVDVPVRVIPLGSERGEGQGARDKVPVTAKLGSPPKPRPKAARSPAPTSTDLSVKPNTVTDEMREDAIGEAAASGLSPGDTGPDESGDGESAGIPWGSETGTGTDPALERAVRLYRARLTAWLASRFSVKGSGLERALLERLSASVTLEVDARRRAVGYRLGSSGNPIFDEAARRAADSVIGLELPPPPPGYPGAVQREIHVKYVCREGACD